MYLKKTTFKELGKKSMTMISHQIYNINKEVEIIYLEKQNRNSKVPKYNIWKEKFTTGTNW